MCTEDSTGTWYVGAGLVAPNIDLNSLNCGKLWNHFPPKKEAVVAVAGGCRQQLQQPSTIMFPSFKNMKCKM